LEWWRVGVLAFRPKGLHHRSRGLTQQNGFCATPHTNVGAMFHTVDAQKWPGTSAGETPMAPRIYRQRPFNHPISPILQYSFTPSPRSHLFTQNFSS
jgi:hypothetical protein